MKTIIPILIVLAIVGGCRKDTSPAPHVAFDHTRVEHGYWQEVSSDTEAIRELHIHANEFSITYNPFETYKDYWGTYTLNKAQDEIRFTVDGGNKLPAFSEAPGRFQLIGEDQIQISGIALNSQRPTKERFHFQRIDTND